MRARHRTIRFLLAAIAAVLVGGLTLPAAAATPSTALDVSAAATAATAKSTPEALTRMATSFAAQARAAGLNDTQIRHLQADVDKEVARTGGTQVAANRVLWPGGDGDTVLQIRGTSGASSIPADTSSSRSVAPNTGMSFGCNYKEFCIYYNTDYTNMFWRMYYCKRYLTGGRWFFSYVNNQTTGTRAAFLDWQGNRIAWTYPAYHRGTTSLAEETNWIKPC